MYQHPKRATAARPRLRWVICGAAPVPVTLIEAYLQMGIEVLQVYGLTETHGGICLMSPEHARAKVGSTGMPYFGIDVRVVDKAGNPVPPGIPGEVVTRGPHLISSYWNRPEATQETIREGWFHTGDIAEVDADGFIYIKDRSKDMVISGGENVYPAEVEDVLSSHAGVREVGVIGQPSAKWGESVCAVVVRGDGWKGDDELLVQELRALAQSRLARFFDPAQYLRARNELALLDASGREQRVDRVVEFDDAVWLIDYKTGDDSRLLSDAELAARHRAQLEAYRALLAALHPGKAVHAALLLGDGRLVRVQASHCGEPSFSTQEA
jgi:acyl-CoA synthetase (AMP-forming)/AMP-acid ligase II